MNPPKDIQVNLQNLGKAIDELDDRIEDLEETFKPVLASVLSINKDEDENQCIPVTPMSGVLRNLTAQVQYINQKIASLIERCEL